MLKLLMVNKNKFFIILFIIIILIFLSFFYILVFDKKILLVKSKNLMYADNISCIFFKFKYSNPVKNHFFSFTEKYEVKILSNNNLVTIIKKDNGFFLKSKYKSGEIYLEIRTKKINFFESIVIYENCADSDMDGFPDVAELTSQTDKENFIDWFVNIAESQFYCKSYNWQNIHQDCSGLITFSFKEALKIHDNNWYNNFNYLKNFEISDIEKFNYPNIPVLGDRIFRTKRGAFKKSDILDDTFNWTATVNCLLNYNLEFISKDYSAFKKGDVLFYYHQDNLEMPYHSMIYTGESNWLVYHTGPLDDNPLGEVRKVNFNELMKHPDKTWHPLPDNPIFLGAYRWKFLI